MPITEKGWRHLSRLLKLIQRKIPVFSVSGLINKSPVDILFDKRGDFDVMTSTALEEIKRDNSNLKFIDKPENIPAYFKQQRKVKFRAVECRIKINDYSIKAKPMILPGNQSTVMLGRYSTEKMFLEFAKNQGYSYSRRTMLIKGQELIQQWAEQKSPNSNQQQEELSSQRPRKSRTKAKRKENEIIDSDSNSDIATRRKRISYSKVRSLWSSDEDETSRESNFIPSAQPLIETTDSPKNSCVTSQKKERPIVDSKNKENEKLINHSSSKYLLVGEELKSTNIIRHRLDREASPNTSAARSPSKRQDVTEFSSNVEPRTVKNTVSVCQNSKVFVVTCENDRLKEKNDKQLRDAETVKTNERQKHNIVSILIDNSQPISPADIEVDVERVNDASESVEVSATKERDNAQISIDDGHHSQANRASDNTCVRNINSSVTIGSAEIDAENSLSRTQAVERGKSFLFSDSLCKFVRDEIANMSAENGSNRDQSASNISIESMSTSDIVRISQEVCERIMKKRKIAEKRREVIGIYKVLCLAEQRLDEDPFFQSSGQEDIHESSKFSEIMDILSKSFKHSAASRVVTDNIQLTDKDKNPLYAVSVVIAVKNLQKAEDEVRPLNIQYFLKDGRIHSSFSTHEPEFIRNQ